MSDCRTWCSVLSLAALALLALGTWLWVRSTHNIDADSFQQIQTGMTQAEVEAILNAPAGYQAPQIDWQPWQYQPLYYSGNSLKQIGIAIAQAPSYVEHWKATEVTIEVGFDAQGRVTAKRLRPTPRYDHSFTVWLRDRWRRLLE